LFTLRSFTLLGAIGSVAFCGWVMSQAAAASRAAALNPPATPAAAPSATPVLGTLTPEQLAALQFSLPKIASQPAATTPLRPAAAPRRVVAPAPAPAPAAKTGTS